MSEPAEGKREYAAERRRHATYGLLAEWYHEPSEKRMRRLAGIQPGTVEVDLPGLAGAADGIEALRLDHAQLFVGPFELAAPPYESVYVDSEGRVMTETTDAVRAEYREAGLDVDMDEPADHVAAELEFVSLLVATELEALAAGESEAAEHYLRRQYEFLSEHLGRWVSEMAENVCENADTEFYRTLAGETRRFVEADGRLLADRLDRLEATDDITDVLDASDTPEAAGGHGSGATTGGRNR